MKYTISDIANICGVSKATVSRIINNKENGFSEETRNKVIKAMDELGYRPNELARSISVSSSKIIGLIIPDIRNPIQTEIVCGTEDYLSKHGYSMILAQTQSDAEKEKRLLLSMVDKRVDGVILCSGSENSEFLKEYRRYNMPISLIGRTFDKEASDTSISGDNAIGAIQAMTFFIQNGHKNIAYIDGNATTSGTQQRLEGYKTALSQHNLPFNPNLVLNSDFYAEDGFEMTQHLIESGEKFTAIITGGDLLAIGAIRALKANRIKVPKDVEIIGFDDIEASRIYDPKISTVRKPHYSMATMTAKMLLQKIDGELGELCHISVKPELILRETTRNNK